MYSELSESDWDILNTVSKMIDDTHPLFGHFIEFALHSLDRHNPVLIKIINGHITNRSVGAPLTNLALEKLSSNKNDHTPYYSYAENGNLLRSTTTIIRSREQKAIGLLCININMSAPLNDVLSCFAPPQQAIPHISPINSPETFSNNPKDMIDDVILRINAAIPNIHRFSPRELNKILIGELFNSGIFALPNSVKIVSEALNISIDIIYRHLRNLRKKDV